MFSFLNAYRKSQIHILFVFKAMRSNTFADRKKFYNENQGQWKRCKRHIANVSITPVIIISAEKKFVIHLSNKSCKNSPKSTAHYQHEYVKNLKRSKPCFYHRLLLEMCNHHFLSWHVELHTFKPRLLQNVSLFQLAKCFVYKTRFSKHETSWVCYFKRIILKVLS